jgi:hypothetical protein
MANDLIDVVIAIILFIGCLIASYLTVSFLNPVVLLLGFLMLTYFMSKIAIALAPKYAIADIIISAIVSLVIVWVFAIIIKAMAIIILAWIMFKFVLSQYSPEMAKELDEYLKS